MHVLSLQWYLVYLDDWYGYFVAQDEFNLRD